MSKGKLLLADDSVTIQKVVNLTFADEGIEVVTAGNGDTAMEMIAENRPDVVLADVNMPGLNGYQICERLRKSESTKDLPVMLLVGSFEPFDENEANRVGANGFMTKPFQSIRQLVTQVSDLIERSIENSEHAAVTSGDMTGDNVHSETIADRDSELWSTAESETPPTDDIEDLYNQSFADTVEIPGPASQTGDELGDAGMDDEIIETAYLSSAAGSVDGPPATSERSPFEDRVTDEVEAASDGTGFIDEHIAVARDVDIERSGPDLGTGTHSSDRAPVSHDALRFEPPGGSFDDSANFSLSGSDLLELPHPTERFPPGPTEHSNEPKEITSLSPELIDMIVQKVIEKMSERH